MEDYVLYLSLKYAGDFQKIYQAIQRKEPIDQERLHLLKAKMKCRYTTIVSDDYPQQLKTISCPPFVLYYYGDLSLTQRKSVGVVGMREMSDYGKRATRYFCQPLLAQGYVIVSGMAKGIDGMAHTTALHQGGKTIAVLGTGIDYCYPSCHHELYDTLKKDHLVMSEYPFDTAPRKEMFPFRNRIIAGLALKILVIEARVKSGTMITVRYALEQGKDVYCVPSRYDDHLGCNELIKQGAILITNGYEMIEEKDRC